MLVDIYGGRAELEGLPWLTVCERIRVLGSPRCQVVVLFRTHVLPR